MEFYTIFMEQLTTDSLLFLVSLSSPSFQSILCGRRPVRPPFARFTCMCRLIVIYGYICISSLLPAKDLIHQLLKTDPNERMTITQFMNHPWINVCIMCFKQKNTAALSVGVFAHIYISLSLCVCVHAL